MSVAIRTVDTDIDELAAMINGAFAADYEGEPRLDFGADYIRWSFRAPGVDPELQVGAYDGDKVVGVGASFPRSLMLRGEPVRAVLSTLFSVHPDYRRRRIGWRLVEERLRRARDKGAQCYFVYLQDDHASQPLYERLGRETDARVERVHRAPFRIRLLDPASVSDRERAAFGDAMVTMPEVPAGPAAVRPLRDEDLPRCRALLNGMQERVPLARIWTSVEELAWQIAHSPNAETQVVERDGEVQGLFNWYVIDRVTDRSRPSAMIENMWLEGLDGDETQALLASAFRRMADAGCATANMDQPLFCDESALARLGFVSFEVYLSLYAVIFDPSLDLSGLDRVYLDAR